MTNRDHEGTTFNDPALAHLGRMLLCGGGAGGVIGAATVLLLMRSGGDGGLDPTGAAAVGAFVGLPAGTVIALLAALVMLRLRRRRPDLPARSQRLVLLALCAGSTLVLTVALGLLLRLSASHLTIVVVVSTALSAAATAAGSGWCLAPILRRVRIDDVRSARATIDTPER